MTRSAFGIVLLSLVSAAHAVIVYGPAGRNLSAPTGPLSNSGWQYQGDIGVFSGTPIAPDYFITAGHIGATFGQTFSFNGVDYTTTAAFDDPGSDLRILKIDGTFPFFAPLFTGKNERGRQAVIIGRGTQRGEEIRLGATKTPKLHGWQWGADDNLRSWGTNVVASIVNGGAGFGDELRFTFNAGVGKNEATLSAGDSGGGVFIRDKGKWKLAAVNYAVDEPYSLTGVTGSAINAAVFDQGGLYTGGDGNWTLVKDVARNLPQNLYATRIESNLGWINSVLSGAVAPDAVTSSYTDVGTVPEPSLLAMSLLVPLVMRRVHQR